MYQCPIIVSMLQEANAELVKMEQEKEEERKKQEYAERVCVASVRMTHLCNCCC